MCVYECVCERERDRERENVCMCVREIERGWGREQGVLLQQY